MTIRRVLLFASPFLFLFELFLFGKIASLLRAPSDFSVLLGTAGLSLFIVLNFFLYRLVAAASKN